MDAELHTPEAHDAITGELVARRAAGEATRHARSHHGRGGLMHYRMVPETTWQAFCNAVYVVVLAAGFTLGVPLFLARQAWRNRKGVDRMGTSWGKSTSWG